MQISVVIPCHNVEDYIEECIDSVLNQDVDALEIICVENNSIDNTFSILKKLELLYPSKIRMFSESKRGASAARNLGLSKATGKWIQFLDADDLLKKDKLSKQLIQLESDLSFGFLASNYERLAIDGQLTKFSFDSNDIFKLLFATKLGITSANLFKREALLCVGGWDESLKSSQEYDLMFRLLQGNYSCFLCEFSDTIIRERVSGQISQSNPKEKWERYIALRLRIINFLKTNNLDYFKKESDFFYQNLFNNIRVLASYDLIRATEIFSEIFDKDFVPNSGQKISIYSLLYKLFGFYYAERITKIFKKQT